MGVNSIAELGYLAPNRPIARVRVKALATPREHDIDPPAQMKAEGKRKAVRWREGYAMPNTRTASDPLCTAVDRPPLLTQSAGISKQHFIPSAAKARLAVPPSSKGMSSRMTLVP
jgi:hypothetical protein